MYRFCIAWLGGWVGRWFCYDSHCLRVHAIPYRICIGKIPLRRTAYTVDVRQGMHCKDPRWDRVQYRRMEKESQSAVTRCVDVWTRCVETRNTIGMDWFQVAKNLNRPQPVALNSVIDDRSLILVRISSSKRSADGPHKLEEGTSQYRKHRGQGRKPPLTIAPLATPGSTAPERGNLREHGARLGSEMTQ